MRAKRNHPTVYERTYLRLLKFAPEDVKQFSAFMDERTDLREEVNAAPAGPARHHASWQAMGAFLTQRRPDLLPESVREQQAAREG